MPDETRARPGRLRRALRRMALFSLVPGLLVVLGWPSIVRRLGGSSRLDPAEMAAGLSEGARALVERAFSGLDSARLADLHVHVAGIGTGGTGCWVNPRLRSWLHPLHHARFQVYLSATGVSDLSRADQQAAARLSALVDGIGRGGRYYLLAFDHHHDAAGRVDLEHSEFYVPNDYVFALAEADGRLRPCVSVHPYRADAVAELERCAARGARLVKWLPNAMGIDPADPRCAPFYAAMAEHGMVLLSHGGEEKAVHAEEAQRLGNPLRLRAALDAGVKVVVAHCASLGRNSDLDDPARGDASNFELFLRLMDDERYEGLVFGEISGLTQVNRLGAPLRVLLEREDLHDRLVNASDYPLPAVNCVFHLRPLVRAGYLTREEAGLLREIYQYNPLLFDFVLKRALRSPTTGRGFADEVFLVPEELGL